MSNSCHLSPKASWQLSSRRGTMQFVCRGAHGKGGGSEPLPRIDLRSGTPCLKGRGLWCSSNVALQAHLTRLSPSNRATFGVKLGTLGYVASPNLYGSWLNRSTRVKPVLRALNHSRTLSRRTSPGKPESERKLKRVSFCPRYQQRTTCTMPRGQGKKMAGCRESGSLSQVPVYDHSEVCS